MKVYFPQLLHHQMALRCSASAETSYLCGGLLLWPRWLHHALHWAGTGGALKRRTWKCNAAIPCNYDQHLIYCKRLVSVALTRFPCDPVKQWTLINSVESIICWVQDHRCYKKHFPFLLFPCSENIERRQGTIVLNNVGIFGASGSRGSVCISFSTTSFNIPLIQDMAWTAGYT